MHSNGFVRVCAHLQTIHESKKRPQVCNLLKVSSGVYDYSYAPIEEKKPPYSDGILWNKAWYGSAKFSYLSSANRPLCRLSCTPMGIPRFLLQTELVDKDLRFLTISYHLPCSLASPRCTFFHLPCSLASPRYTFSHLPCSLVSPRYTFSHLPCSLASPIGRGTKLDCLRCEIEVVDERRAAAVTTNSPRPAIALRIHRVSV